MENPLYYEQALRPKEPNPPKKENRNKNYLIAGNLWINVDYDVYLPDPKRLLNESQTSPLTAVLGRSKQAIIYACGWPNKPRVNPNFHDRFAQELADRSGIQTFYTDTSAGRIVTNSLEKEAVAMEKMIEDEGLEEVILMGHSEGAKKVLYLIREIRERNKRLEGVKPPIKIRGLALIQAMGLNDQPSESVIELIIKFVVTEGMAAVRAISVMTKSEKYKSSARFRDSVARARSEAFKSSFVIARSILSDVVQYGATGYLVFLRSQVQDMIKQAPGIEQIDVPVILVQAKDDVISSREAIIPEYLDKLAFEATRLPREEAERLNIHQTREQHLKSSLFKSSPYIRAIIPTYYGVHSITALRPELAVVIDFFKRYERDNNR